MVIAADYNKTIETAIHVLQNYGVKSFPVDLKFILSQINGIKIVPYGRIMEREHLSRDTVRQQFGSDFGTSVSDSNGRYIIYYNEINSEQTNRFTIAHELGHYFLDHHDTFDCQVLNADTISENQRKELENEASSFARNLLAPAYATSMLAKNHGISREISGGNSVWKVTQITPLTENLESYIDFEALIVRTFNITSSAATARAGLLSSDQWHISHAHIDETYIHSIFNTSIWHCDYCNAERMPGAVYCTNCARKYFAYGKRGERKYHKEIHANENGKLSECPLCKNSQTSRVGEYCKICGLALSNRCSSDPSHVNHPEAKYCQVCGSPTSYFESGIIEVIHQNYKELKPMVYTNTIPYDEGTMRVKKCPRCENEVFGKNADYCRICGLKAINYCNPVAKDEWDPSPHACTPESRFCEICGGKTTYFTGGILKPYTEVLAKRPPRPIFSQSIDANEIPF